MDIWLIFAYISNGKVVNIASYLYTGYSEANSHAKIFTGNSEAIAIDVTHIPVQINDDYVDGVFSRDGNIISPLSSQSEQIAELNQTVDDLIIAITPTEVNA